MSQTQILFLNHASILIKYESSYLLCDPWFEKPAFGSWLPTFPIFTHPVYLASLKGKLSILISHGHDDHCDDDLLQLFDKDTTVISSDFASPSVQRRVLKLGFKNFVAANNEGASVGCFEVNSFRNDHISEDDATYIIKTPDALIVHCNDNWVALEPWQHQMIMEKIGQVGIENTVFMSQTNSASGFPLNYANYSKEEKAALLKAKVEKMISTGMRNAQSLGIKHFHSYAGYASVFVKDKPSYLEDSLFPTPRYIKEKLAHLIPEGVEVLDFYPGDIFDFKTVQKSFFGSDIADEDIKEKSNSFYHQYGQVKQCDTYNGPGTGKELDMERIKRQLVFFLQNLDAFVTSKTQKSDFHASIIGKRLQIEVVGAELTMTLEFGKGLVESETFNKKIIVVPEIIRKVLDGEILFENLYTGYNAEFMREPADAYNRDIVQYIVMYSYVYKNRLASTFE